MRHYNKISSRNPKQKSDSSRSKLKKSNITETDFPTKQKKSLNKGYKTIFNFERQINYFWNFNNYCNKGLFAKESR